MLNDIQYDGTHLVLKKKSLIDEALVVHKT